MTPRPVLFFDFDDTLSEQTPFLLLYARALGKLLAPHPHESELWTQSAADMLEGLANDYAARFTNNPRNGYNAWLNIMRAQAVHGLFARHNLPVPTDPKALALRLQDAALRQCNALLPGAQEAVRTLYDAGYTLHVASANDSEHLRSALAGAELERYFTTLFGPDLIDCAKEGPEFYACLFAFLHLPPEQAIIIDNDPLALAWAMQAGARGIQVNLLPQETPETASSLLAVVTDLFTLPAFIAAL